jgi:hypothetical protein
MSDDAPDDHLGAAASRWLGEIGELPKHVGGKPGSSQHVADMVLKAKQLLLEWHGDFGASRMNTVAMATMTMEDIERHVE